MRLSATDPARVIPLRQYKQTKPLVASKQQHDKPKGPGHADKESELVLPQSISYRATNPLYAEEDYEIVLREEGGAGSSVNIFDHAGVVSMKAEIEA